MILILKKINKDNQLEKFIIIWTFIDLSMIWNITINENFLIGGFIWVEGVLTRNLLLDVDLIYSINIENNLTDSNNIFSNSKERIS